MTVDEFTRIINLSGFCCCFLVKLKLKLQNVGEELLPSESHGDRRSLINIRVQRADFTLTIVCRKAFVIHKMSVNRNGVLRAVDELCSSPSSPKQSQEHSELNPLSRI